MEDSAVVVIRALRRHGGAARVMDLLRAGLTRTAIDNAVRTGRVERPVRGLVALPGTRADSLAVAALGGALTCLSACVAWGLPLLSSPGCAHVVIPERQNRRGPRSLAQAVRIHRADTEVLPSADCMPIVLPGEALRTASYCLPPRAHLVVADAMLARGLVHLGDFAGWPARCGARGEWLARRADGRAQSPLETLARLALTDAGYEVTPQVRIPGVGRVDLVVEGRVVIEADGAEHHLTPTGFQRDRERDRGLAAWGLPVLRFTYADLLGESDLIVREVRAALGARGTIHRIGG